MQFDIHNERCFGLYCGRRKQSIWPKDKTFWFASGREAVVALLKSFDFEKRVALLPAFLPEGIYAPFMRCGWKIYLYHLDKYLNPEWHKLEMLIARIKPKLAVFIHYFGLPKPIDKFCRICHKHEIVVIEDMAHLLPNPNQHLISPADLILFSLPKLLGVPDGAPLIVNTNGFKIGSLEYYPGFRHFIYLVQQMAILLTNTMSRLIPAPRAGRGMRHLVRRYSNSYSTLMKYFERPHRMSILSHAILSIIDFEKNFERRQEYAGIYRENLDRTIFEFFPESGESRTAMFGFPVLVDDRDGLLGHLARRRISGISLVDRWDFIAANERSDHTDTINVMSRHFLFPTSPHLRHKEIEYIVDAANSWRTRKAIMSGQAK